MLCDFFSSIFAVSLWNESQFAKSIKTFLLILHLGKIVCVVVCAFVRKFIRSLVLSIQFIVHMTSNYLKYDQEE